MGGPRSPVLPRVKKGWYSFPVYSLLIADDEYEIRNGLANLFPWQDVGFQPAGTAENGKKALEFIENNPVDVLLCDIMMPIMNGIDLAKILHERFPNVKTIFLSGYRDFEYAQQALAYGVKKYVVKPTKYNELFEIFQQLRAELDRERRPDPDAQTGKPEEWLDAGFHDRIIAIINEYVETSYREASLGRAAELVRMSSFYVSKLYKAKTGCNFSWYLLSVKMRKAEELLRDVNRRTSEVSDLLGYGTPKSFTRAFKKFYGRNPRDFRNAQAQAGT